MWAILDQPFGGNWRGNGTPIQRRTATVWQIRRCRHYLPGRCGGGGFQYHHGRSGASAHRQHPRRRRGDVDPPGRLAFPQLIVGFLAQRRGSSMRCYVIGGFGRAVRTAVRNKTTEAAGFVLCCGRIKTLPFVAFDPLLDGRREDVHRGSLFTRSAGVPC